MLIAYALLATIAPLQTPSLPLKLTKSMELLEVSVSEDVWSQGTNRVAFEYVTPKTVSEVAKDLTAELPGAPKPDGDNPSYNYSRQVGPVRQFINILLKDRRSTKAHDARHGTSHIRLTSVMIGEDVDPAGPAPKTWYAKAIAPTPPVPMIEIPFLPGKWTTAMEYRSFDALMSPHNIHGEDHDATLFGAHIHTRYPVLLKKVEAWAATAGYKKTEAKTYFHPGPGAFEIVLNPDPSGNTNVEIYATKNRNPTHPINHRTWRAFKSEGTILTNL